MVLAINNWLNWIFKTLYKIRRTCKIFCFNLTVYIDCVYFKNDIYLFIILNCYK